MTRRRFFYRARTASGEVISDSILAGSRLEALRLIAEEQRTTIEIRETDQNVGATAISAEEPALAIRQLAVLASAGIELLEALEIVAASFPGRQLANCMRATGLALRRGESFAAALRSATPLSYPDYVYALVAAGEASGRLASVLGEAAARLEADHLTRRDIQNAFVYPAFLLASGAASLVFLLYTVVPRFDQMLNNAQTKVSGFSGLILGAGRLFHDHAIAISAILIAAIGGLYALLQTREGREAFQALAARTPVLGSIITIRRRAAWARTMALALGAGVSVLDATALAASALPDGAVRHGARTSIAALKSGKPIDEAYLSVGAISPIDAGLIRAGQRTGALAEMFRAVADRNDADLKVALKRFTLIVEPVAVAIVAITIGAIVLGLVSALVSIYDSIG